MKIILHLFILITYNSISFKCVIVASHSSISRKKEDSPAPFRSEISVQIQSTEPLPCDVTEQETGLELYPSVSLFTEEEALSGRCLPEEDIENRLLLEAAKELWRQWRSQVGRRPCPNISPTPFSCPTTVMLSNIT